MEGGVRIKVEECVRLKTFQLLIDFSIQMLDPIFTDGHRLLKPECKFRVSQPKQESSKSPSNNRVKWREKDKNTFVQNIEMTRVNTIHDELEETVQHRFVDQAFIIHIAIEISNVFQTSATQTFK